MQLLASRQRLPAEGSKSPETTDTKPQLDHAQWSHSARHLMRMTVLDPLVSIKPSTEAARRGWAVAAAIIGRMQEADLVGIDLPAILRPVIQPLAN